MDAVLPPQVSEQAFTQALDAFARVVGPDWVFTSEQDRYSYLDAFAPGNADRHQASAAVAPESVEEIQALLKIANQYQIPLWPVSTGKNLAYGGAAPRLNGSVVLDLKRMNKIIEVNEELGYALVEPGVSFFDLFNYIQERGIKLWISTPAPGWGSVMGNALERGFGYTPYGDHAAMQCGMEVVLPDGEIIRTGMGAITDGDAWQLFKPGYGPSWDGMFMQSNYGVVTKMGIWLMPEPEATANCTISVYDEKQLSDCVEILRPLRLDDTITSNAVIANAVRRTAVASARDQWYQGEGAMPEAAIQNMVEKQGIGRWTVTFPLYDTEEVVESRLKVIKKAFAKIPGIDFEVRRWRRGEPLEKSAARIPSLRAFQVLNWRGGRGGHIDFAPVVMPKGDNAVKLYEFVRSKFSQYGFDYFGGFTLGKRYMIHTAVIIYDQDNDEMTKNARDLFASLIKDGGDKGFGEYRTHISYMDLVAEQFDFNNHSMLRFNELIKDSIDPNGILAAGKQGIWPRYLRDDFKPGKNV